MKLSLINLCLVLLIWLKLQSSLLMVIDSCHQSSLPGLKLHFLVERETMEDLLQRISSHPLLGMLPLVIKDHPH